MEGYLIIEYLQGGRSLLGTVVVTTTREANMTANKGLFEVVIVPG